MDNGFFRSLPDEREPYTVVIPPPNVTGVLHMGHMLNNTIQDILVRRARMTGHNACWVPGTDHASIATEAKVVARLAERGIRKSDLTREEFLRHAWEWKEEHGGIIRHGAKMLFAYSAATVPKITVVLRKAYGGAYLAMCSKDLGADKVFAWPTAEIAVMGAEGAANVVFRREIEAAEDTEARRAELVEEYRETFSTPYMAASRGLVDDIIDPADTRREIALSLELLAGKRQLRPAKKHGLFPA